MEDDGRLPGYALGLAEEQPAEKRARKGDHTDEDPALKPVDLFVGGLPPHADEMGVFDAVVAAGEVVGVKLIRRKRDRGDCRGYGFVRVANQEAAEAVCQTVKEACGVPVALSMLGGQPLGELHAAAREHCAVHALAVPEEDCSLRRLLEAVKRQQDPAAAVTTALVAVLHVPSRPRLAFPGGRPRPKPAEAGTAPGSAEQAPAAAGEQQGGSRGEEKPADRTLAGSNYLERFPAVKALMEQFRARGQEAKTPLAVVNEYAARLALRVELEEAGAAEAGAFTASAKLVDVSGRQLASSTGSGRTKQIAKQVAGAELLTSILETTPAEDLLAPGKSKQQWQQAQQQRPAFGPEGGRGRGGRIGPLSRIGGRAGPDLASRGGWGRAGGRFGERPHFMTAQEEGAWGYGPGGAAVPNAGQAVRPLPQVASGGGFGAAQYGRQPGGVGRTMPSVGAGYGGVVPGSQAQVPSSSQLGGTGSTGPGQLAGFAGAHAASAQVGLQQPLQAQQAQLQAQQQLLAQQFQALQQAQAQLQAQAAALAGSAALGGVPAALGMAGAASQPVAAMGGAAGGAAAGGAGSLPQVFSAVGSGAPAAAPSFAGPQPAASLPHLGTQQQTTAPTAAAAPPTAAAQIGAAPAPGSLASAPFAATSTQPSLAGGAYSPMASQQAAQRASQELAFASYLAQQAQQAAQGQAAQPGQATPPYGTQAATQQPQQAAAAPATQQRPVQYSQPARVNTQPAAPMPSAPTNSGAAPPAAAGAERKYISNTAQQQQAAAALAPATAAAAPAATAAAAYPVSGYASAAGAVPYDPAVAAAAAYYGQHPSGAYDPTNPSAAAAAAYPGYYGGAYAQQPAASAAPASAQSGAGGAAVAAAPAAYPWPYGAYYPQ